MLRPVASVAVRPITVEPPAAAPRLKHQAKITPGGDRCSRKTRQRFVFTILLWLY